MPDILALVGAACALVMVIGSLVLLYRGTITLKEANPEEAIRVEFQKVIDIQTRYPALGLFVLGIVFLVASYWFENLSMENAAKLNAAKLAEIQIPVDSEDPGDTKAHFLSDFGDVRIDNDRKIVIRLPGNLDQVQVTIKETGYETWDRAIHPNQAKDGKLIMSATLKKILQKPSKDDHQIVEPPVDLPPREKAGKNSEYKTSGSEGS